MEAIRIFFNASDFLVSAGRIPKTPRPYVLAKFGKWRMLWEQEYEKLNGVLLFVAGSLLGAGLALLLARQSGRRTRREIVHLEKMAKGKSEQIQLEMCHAIENLVEDISEKVQEGMDRGREWTEKTTQGVLQALNLGTDYIRKELENVMSR